MGIAHHLAVGGTNQSVDGVGGVARATLEHFLLPLAQAKAHVGIAADRCGIATIAAGTLLGSKGHAIATRGRATADTRRKLDVSRGATRQGIAQLAATADGAVADGEAALQSRHVGEAAVGGAGGRGEGAGVGHHIVAEHFGVFRPIDDEINHGIVTAARQQGDVG